MKYTLALVLALTATTTLAADKTDVELDRAVRLQNLTVSALINGDYVLACKAQTQVVDALNKSWSAGPDLLGSAKSAQHEFCDLTLNKVASN